MNKSYSKYSLSMINKIKKIFVLIFIVGLLSTQLCKDVTLPGDLRLPRCQKSSKAEPERINIDTYASNYGSIKPCESYIEFYIARNAQLRSISSSVSVSFKEKKIGNHDFQVVFSNTDGYLLKNIFKIPRYEDYICSELDIELAQIKCFDTNNSVMSCPPIRLKTTIAFKDLTIEEDALNVCYDN